MHWERREREKQTDTERVRVGGLPWTFETRSHLLILNRSPPGKQTLKYVSPWVPFSFKPPQIVSLHFKTETRVRKACLLGVVVCLYSQPQNSQETEAGGSRSWDKPGLHCQTLAQKKKIKQEGQDQYLSYRRMCLLSISPKSIYFNRHFNTN